MSNSGFSGKKSDSEVSPETEAPAPERSVAEDLADGFDLVFRAAKKAVRGLDAGRIEELGKRAVKSVESLDPRQVQDFGRKAAQHLDPKKLEDLAEDATRELIGVATRVAERVETFVGQRKVVADSPAADAADPAGGNEGKKRVRVGE